MAEMREHHLFVRRQARYYTLGNAQAPREVWFVLHGYGQLAAYFIRHFRAIDDGARLVVAPEALSRFYLNGVGRDRRVGASWMTRDDRLAEIDDYVAYLDDLSGHLGGADGWGETTVHVLGFSQGGATACRWLAEGQARIDRLTLWGSHVPHDYDFETHGAALSRAQLTLVAGTDDEYATPERVAEHEAWLHAHGVAFRALSFGGGHRLDAAMLREVAAYHQRETG